MEIKQIGNFQAIALILIIVINYLTSRVIMFI